MIEIPFIVANSTEHKKLEQCLVCSKDILMYVNQHVKECENRQKLIDIQKRLDKKHIENSQNKQVLEYKVRMMLSNGLLTLLI